MTSLAMRRPWTSANAPSLHGGSPTGGVGGVDVVSGAAVVLRPLLVSAGVITAAVTWPVPALAAPLGDSTDNTVNVNGIVISAKLYATTKPEGKQPK